MNRTFLRFFTLSLAFVCGFTTLHAQSPIAQLRPIAQSNRVPANPDFGPQTQLTGHIPGWVANGTATAKSVDLNADMRLTIVLQRDPAVQAAFTQFLQDQQTPGNPLYHQWITPEQVGTLFGPTASDLGAVTNWLSAQGLVIDQVQPNRILIDVHGSTSAVGSAFHTSFGYFPLNGETHRSAVNEPYIPTALSAVISIVFGLTDLQPKPLSFRSGPVPAVPATGATTGPQPLDTVSSSVHYMTPGDFAIVYDSASVLSGGNKGAGTNAHVAVIGQSFVATTDISEFATLTNIGSGYTLNLIGVPGSLPPAICTVATASTCDNADQGEQTLDVDRVVGNAPNVTVDLIAAASSSGGIGAAIQYNVNTQKDPIMTISYGGCEALNPGASAAYDSVFSTAAAEGISTFVSAGDSGVNGCAPGNAANTNTYTASMNFICASSWVTCVGGTEFADTASPSTYWASSNSAGLVSALGYIPEGAWNEPGTASPFQTSATGGGPSTVIAKPSYQTGTGVPNDGMRDTPDVAYPAAGHDGYLACLDYATGVNNDNCASKFVFGGTSAAAPAMAGVTALLNTKLGTKQGSLNPLLYTLAATPSNNVFHDVTISTSAVSGCVVTTPSMCNNSTPGSSLNSTTAAGGQPGYLLQTGYDMVTGWGSIDVGNLLTAASSKVSTTLAVTATSNTIAAGGSDTFTATLTRSSSTPGAATGSVQFYNGGVAFGSAVTISSNVATTPATTFSSAGTDSITAIYSGDTNYATSTSPTYTLTVTAAPTFSVTPASTALSLTSGATTGNTDVITFASLNTFAGTVNYTCSATNSSGTAAGTCALVPTSGTLTSGGNATSTLTITTTPGTSGVLNVTVTGTSGSTVVTSSTIAVTLTASSYTMAASPLTLNLTSGATTGNTSVVTLTSVNGFAGSVAITCTATKTSGNAAGSCAGTTPVTLTAGGTVTSTVTLTSTAGTAGVLSLAVSGSGAPTGGTIAATASIPTPITATLVTPGFTLTPATASISVISGATTGNTTPITVTSTNGLAGTVTVTCVATNASGTAAGVCTATPVTVTANGTATSTVTVTSTPGTSGTLSLAIGGTAGTVTATTPTPVVTTTLTAASFTATGGAAISIAAGATTGTSTVALTSPNLFAGTVTFTCTATNPSVTNAGTTTCSVTPATLTAGGTATANVSLTTTLGSSGSITLNITGTGTTTGATLSTSATATVAATVAPPSYTMTAPAALTIATSGATTGNTTSTTLTSTAFAGTVNFTCSLTATSGSPANPATCAASSVTLTSGGIGTSTITVTSTTAHAKMSGPQQAGLTGWGIRGGVLLAMLLCLAPFRRRRFVRPLAAFALLAFGLMAMSGCSSGGGTTTKSSSDGTYTGTVTGSGTSTSAGAAFSTSATFTLTITN